MKNEQFSTEDGQNSVQEFRDRILMVLGCTTVPFITPFLILHCSNGSYAMAALDAVVLFLLIANSISIYRTLKRLIPFWFCYLLFLLVLIASVFLVGGEALFWSFPLLFIMGFLADKQTSRILMVLSLLTLVPLALYSLNIQYASRFAMALFLVCIFSDVLFGYIYKIQTDLSLLAIRDPLTNALNRRELERYLNDAIEETKRGFGPASLVILDIDHFKDLNDTHGHGVGDKALIGLVETLHHRRRRLDHVFRIGGEEFLILLRNTTEEQAITTAESLRHYVEGNDILDGHSITISLGAAEYKADETVSQWLARADEHLYDAKRLGRNQVCPVGC